VISSDLKKTKKERKENLELVFIETPKKRKLVEILQHTGIMLFVNCPTSSVYVNEKHCVWHLNGTLLLWV